jgi:hypothetical protein
MSGYGKGWVCEALDKDGRGTRAASLLEEEGPCAGAFADAIDYLQHLGPSDDMAC